MTVIFKKLSSLTVVHVIWIQKTKCKATLTAETVMVSIFCPVPAAALASALNRNIQSAVVTRDVETHEFFTLLTARTRTCSTVQAHKKVNILFQ